MSIAPHDPGMAVLVSHQPRMSGGFSGRMQSACNPYEAKVKLSIDTEAIKGKRDKWQKPFEFWMHPKQNLIDLQRKLAAILDHRVADEDGEYSFKTRMIPSDWSDLSGIVILSNGRRAATHATVE